MTETTEGKTATTAEWKAAGVHTITVPTGATVRIRIPDLSLLIAEDALPEDLRGSAMEELLGAVMGLSVQQPNGDTAGEKPKVTLERDDLKRLGELHYFMVAQMLVEPQVSIEELKAGGFPNEDLELLTELAMRRRSTDARGKTLGVAPLSRFTLFREVHSCPEDCPHCQTLVERFSLTRLLQV